MGSMVNKLSLTAIVNLFLLKFPDESFKVERESVKKISSLKK